MMMTSVVELRLPQVGGGNFVIFNMRKAAREWKIFQVSFQITSLKRALDL